MDRHKQRLIDSAVKILDDEVASNIEKWPRSVGNLTMVDTMHNTKYKFVNSLVEQIDYVINSLLFQPDKNIIFDCTIYYLDTFIKEFDTLYSPSHRQRQENAHFTENEDLTFFFDGSVPTDNVVEPEHCNVLNYVVFDIRQRFNAPFKIIQGGWTNILYPNILGWITSSKPCTFIKIYMTAVRDFFVSVRPTSSSKDKTEIDEFFKGLGKGPKTFKKKKRGTK
jgi:hypothetical protein